MGDDTKVFSADHLRRLGEELFAACGAPPDEALTDDYRRKPCPKPSRSLSGRRANFRTDS